MVHQFSKVLPNNHQARKAFIATRGLARTLEMKQELKADASKVLLCWHQCCLTEL